MRECLDSLVAQTVPRDRFEVVVVHRGDDPDLLEAVAALRSQHPRLNLRMLEAREPGAGHARNVGIAAARGDYLTFVDADDRVAPRYLEALLEEADPGIVVVAMVADARPSFAGRSLCCATSQVAPCWPASCPARSATTPPSWSAPCSLAPHGSIPR